MNSTPYFWGRKAGRAIAEQLADAIDALTGDSVAVTVAASSSSTGASALPYAATEEETRRAARRRSARFQCVQQSDGVHLNAQRRVLQHGNGGEETRQGEDAVGALAGVQEFAQPQHVAAHQS